MYMDLNNAIHRDIKPANILVFGDLNDIHNQYIKVSDFGCGIVMDDSMNDPETIVGTRGYMAPEMVRKMQSNG